MGSPSSDRDAVNTILASDWSVGSGVGAVPFVPLYIMEGGLDCSSSAKSTSGVGDSVNTWVGNSDGANVVGFGVGDKVGTGARKTNFNNSKIIAAVNIKMTHARVARHAVAVAENCTCPVPFASR